MGQMQWIMTSPFHLFRSELKALNEKEQALLWIYIAPDGGMAAPGRIGDAKPALPTLRPPALGSSCHE